MDRSPVNKTISIEALIQRSRTLLTRWRVRLAHVVLLPELNADQARDLRADVQEEGKLSSGYVLMSILSAGIATFGLLQSSTAVVIGAMLISPLMAPIAALGFGFASLDGRRIREAARVVLIGAAIGIVTGILLTWISPIRNATPEIIARTQPTLLDLAIALLSGLAGGYATVRRKGGTAIGVAIATALMPPLATLGYSLGVFELRFALGALLLFLTNLAAIAFAFALIARLSGAARPLTKVEWAPGHVAAAVATFAMLATPLAMTLVRVTNESSARHAARSAIEEVFGGASTRIAQMEVAWPLFGDPRIDAVVISPGYSANAQRQVQDRLARQLGVRVTVTLQQVVAADLTAKARAMVDAAMERTVAGIAADVPPFTPIRESIGIPSRSMWVNRAERTVFVEPVDAAGWRLADYRAAEITATGVARGWHVQIVPPAQPALVVRIDADAEDPAAIPPELAIWALDRWGMNKVRFVPPPAPKPAPPAKAEPEAEAPPVTQQQTIAERAIALFGKAGIAAVPASEAASVPGNGTILVQVNALPPVTRDTEAAAVVPVTPVAKRR